MSIRVLYITGASIIGGAESNMLRVIEHEREYGVEPVGVLVPDHGPLLQRLEKMNIPAGNIQYYSFSPPNPFRYYQTLYQLTTWVRHTRPDVIHMNLQILVEYAWRLKQITHRPVICDVRNVYQRNEFVPSFRQWMKNIDLVIPCCYAVKQNLIDMGVSTQNVAVIYDGVELPALQTKNKSALLHHEYKLSPDTPIVAIIGRVEPEKGIKEFIDAARQVLDIQPKINFMVIGADAQQGQLINQYKEYARKLDIAEKIHFTGFRNDILNLLNELDLFVLASWASYEALPNSILEAMTAGVLVVATQVGGVPEMITDGISGYLVQPKNPSALAEAILNALRLKKTTRENMISTARKIVEDNFSIQQQVQKLQQIYTSLKNGSYIQTVLNTVKSES